jgi:tRNA C32,U32 (ribose-2'-O)-methylase TrmJ
MAQLEEGAENAFGVKEKAFTFGTLEKGSAEVTQRVRIANTGTVECSVALSIAPQASYVHTRSAVACDLRAILTDCTIAIVTAARTRRRRRRRLRSPSSPAA